MNILDDVVMMSSLSVHVIEAAGRLPAWVQKSRRETPDSTVWSSGLNSNESRMSEVMWQVCVHERRREER